MQRIASDASALALAPFPHKRPLQPQPSDESAGPITRRRGLARKLSAEPDLLPRTPLKRPASGAFGVAASTPEVQERPAQMRRLCPMRKDVVCKPAVPQSQSRMPEKGYIPQAAPQRSIVAACSSYCARRAACDEEELMVQFTPGPRPEEVDPSCCMARTWNNGRGGQCMRRRKVGCDVCGIHIREIAHGRLDGPVPARKLEEMKRACAALAGLAAPAAQQMPCQRSIVAAPLRPCAAELKRPCAALAGSAPPAAQQMPRQRSAAAAHPRPPAVALVARCAREASADEASEPEADDSGEDFAPCWAGRLRKRQPNPRLRPSAAVPPKAKLKQKRCAARQTRAAGSGRRAAPAVDMDDLEMPTASEDALHGPSDLGPPIGGPLTRAAWALRAGARRGQAEDGHLTGREAEQAEVFDFVGNGVRAGGAREVLYVSGMPGTGKTASVLKVVRALKAKKQGFKSPFTFVHVNAMCLSTPGAVFAEICHKIPALARSCRGRLSEGLAHERLAGFFSETRRQQVVVLLLDEVDCLVTQAQSVLYRLFDWLSLPGARLVMMAIANTMDLPERLLPRVASRLGVRRVNFMPYDRAQLRSILLEHLRAGEAAGAFCDDALTLCAARVAGSSGDARKALQVCRRAVEVRLQAADRRQDVQMLDEGGDAEPLEDGKAPISVQEVAAAESDLLRVNPAARAIAGLGLKARRLLLAIVLELRQRPGASALPVRAVVRRYEGLVALARRELKPVGGAGAAVAAAAAAAAASEAAAVWDDDCGLQSPADDALYCLQRLEAMALLRGPPEGFAVALLGGAAAASESCAELAIELGESVDLDDISDALLGAKEEDVLAKELLGRNDAPQSAHWTSG